MIRDIFELHDVEHLGDIDHFTHLIIDAGGTILKVVWNDEDDDDTAYIVYLHTLISEWLLPTIDYYQSNYRHPIYL